MGNSASALLEGFPPKSLFNTSQIPDLTGRVILVTGGNVGIGYETIKALLEHNAKVYMASRSREKSQAAIEELKKSTGKEAIFLELDLASFASIRKAAAEFLSKEKELHVLFNNAGVMWVDKKLFTVEGYDMQFGTNVVGPFLFTELLMPALFAGKETSPDGHARIIITSSSGAHLDVIHWGSFKDGPERKKMSTQALYYQSKHANVVVARQIVQRYADKGIIAISCNPGNIKSELQRTIPTVIRKFMDLTILYPTPYGALTQLWAGTMPEPLSHNGKYLKPWARVGECRKEAYDPEVGERLWNWLQEQVKE